MIGIFSKTLDSNMIEAAGYSGLDFIILDQEHGPNSEENLHHHIRAAAITGMESIVRVREVNANVIGSALDAGAGGVQVPNIESIEQAKQAVEAARFHPLGSRGVCRFVKAAEFGTMDKASYFKSANKKRLVLQVEGQKGLSQLDEILAIEGYDVLFIGPYDLSQSMGMPGQVTHREIIKLMKEVATKAKAHNKVLGTFSDDMETAKLLISVGFDYMAYSVDVNIFSGACAAIKNQLTET